MVANTNIIPGMPAIPDYIGDDDNLANTVAAMKEAIEVLTGARGNPNSRALTWGDATEDGKTDLFVTNRVVETAIGGAVSTTMSGDLTGTGTFAADGTVIVPSVINLPNIILVEGGAAGTTFVGALNGPYGIEGAPAGGTINQVIVKLSSTDGDWEWQNQAATSTGTALTIQEDGVSLATAVSLINFVGFDLTEPSNNQITVTYGPAVAGSEYAPGYDYSQVSTTTFTVDLVDALNTFRVGRRLKFGLAGTYTYGVVASGDYNSTAANDTFLTMTMEGGDTIPATIDELYIVAGGASWSSIAGDPFSGGQINDITTGAISGAQWWVAVGDGSKVATSTDGGVTWAIATVGTENILTICYNATTETFWLGGPNQTFYKTTDGTTWSDQSALLTDAAVSDAADDILTLRALPAESNGMVMGTWDDSASANKMFVTADEWVTLTNRADPDAPAQYDHVWANTTPGTANNILGYVDGTDIYFYNGTADPSASFAITLSGQITAAANFDMTTVEPIAGDINGQITRLRGGGDSIDNVTFSAPVLGFAHSPLHARVVAVGASGMIGYISETLLLAGTADSWTSVTNGFDVLADVTCVAWNASDGVYIACASNGQICRSSNGTN